MTESIRESVTKEELLKRIDAYASNLEKIKMWKGKVMMTVDESILLFNQFFTGILNGESVYMIESKKRAKKEHERKMND